MKMVVERVAFILVGLATSVVVSGTSNLPSNFYKQGRGLLLEKWVLSAPYGLENFNNIPNYPRCPTHIFNLDSFSDDVYIRGYNQHNRYSAYFVSPQNGNHTFFMLCNNECRLEIEILPFGTKVILSVDIYTDDSWSDRKWAKKVNLQKDFRYLIKAYQFSNSIWPEYLMLGVKFPDGSEVKPIDKRFLWRPMEFYQWQGLLAQKYDGITFPSGRSMSTFYSDNAAKYPENANEYKCAPTLYKPFTKIAEYFAMMFVGYMKLPKTGDYTFKVNANEIGELSVTRGNIETRIGYYDKKLNPNTLIGGNFNSSVHYPVKAVIVESNGNDYLNIEHKTGAGPYDSSWNGMLQNLLLNQTMFNTPLPFCTVMNSSVISAALNITPYLAPRDNWTFTNKFDILAFETKYGEAAQVIKLESSGLPKTFNFTGLKNYTDYSIYVQYYGKINNTIEYNIITWAVEKRTDENVPEAPPAGIFTRVISSKSARITWRSYTNVEIVNGICTGYEVRYKIKGDGNWTSVIINNPSNREHTMVNLEEYTTYHVIVAGRTKKGTGVFSSSAEITTKQDAPSAPPLNIAAKNTSSSSIFISWDDVPYWDRNGIIIGYKVYISKSGGAIGPIIKTTTYKTLTHDGLDYWQFYDVQVTALTEKGEGPKSNVTRVRTDEDRPAAPPKSLTAKAFSSSAINVTWVEIDASKTHGIILEYIIKFCRSDGEGSVHEAVSSNMSALLSNLEAFIDYDIQVAGVTSKGYGVYSSEVTERTLQAAPDWPPTEIVGNNISSTAIKVFWGTIPKKHRNGNITGYMIKYREKRSHGNWIVISVNSNTFNLIITDLDFYTFYDVSIAGKNAAGVGVYSNVTKIRTDADAPGKAPLNLTGNFLNHTAIVMRWQSVPNAFRFGTIIGYRLLYRDKTKASSPWVNLIIPNRFNGSDSYSQTITGLKIYTPYVFKISAFTVSDGPFSKDVTVWTDEHAPENPPRNLTGQNASSTEVVLNWNRMGEVHGDANGKVLGYTIRYHVVDCHEDRPIGCDELEIFNTTTYGPRPTMHLTNLRKYTVYNISIQMFNSKGEGNFSNEVTMTTDEDKPDAPPSNCESWPTDYDAIKVFWSPIPESLRNGIILGYRIFYKPIKTRLYKYYRAPRSVNPLAVYGAEPGEKMLEVNATTYSAEINELRNYSWYRIRIGAFTSKGIGRLFSINGTCKQKAPTAAPHLMIKDKYDFYEIFLRWNEINGSDANGEVLGYNIKYWLKELFFTPIFATTVMELTVWAPNTSVILVNLKPFATYGFTVTAFTEGGIGRESEIFYGETCRCPKILSTSKLNFPPLTHDSDEHQNILAQMVNDAIVSCCGNCSNGHGTTEIDWTRDASNHSSLKFNKESALNASIAGTHVIIPIFRDMDDIQIAESGTSAYVPILAITTFNTFSRKPSLKIIGNAATKIVLESLWQQYPLFVVSTVLTVLAGIVLWIAESNVNKNEFPGSYIQGSGNGVWLAFITMTTVGYGDLTPVTKLGRIIAMAWMLIGLVLTSLVVGNLSNLMNVEFVLKPQPMGGKVLTSDDTLLIASKIFGTGLKIGSTTDGKFIQKSLFSGNVSRVFVDSYQASSLRGFLSHPDIILESIHNVKASYGVLLSGEAKRLSTCVSKYVKENENSFLKKVANASHTYKLEASTTTEFYKHMTSPHSDIMENLKTYGGVMLVILVLIGILYEVIRFLRGRAKIHSTQNKVNEVFENMRQSVEDLGRSVEEKLEEIETRHNQERLQLNKMQIGEFEALLKIYPDLPLFDQTIPNSGKYAVKKYDEYDTYGFDYKEENFIKEIEIPIYYKRSQIDLQP